MNYSLGLDGCKGGWLAVSMTSLKSQRITLLENISVLYDFGKPWANCWIDMPIGLSEGDMHRNLEAYARPFLRPYRASTIFTPPCLDRYPRKLVKADDILDAICLSLSAYLSRDQAYQLIQGDLKTDKQGLFIRMAFPNIP